MAAITKAKVASILKKAGELIGTLDEPTGKPDPELAPFISAIRVNEHVGRVSTTSLDVTFQFDMKLAPRMSDYDRQDFKEALRHDVWRRLVALGIEFGAPFTPVWGRGWKDGDVIFPVKAKSRGKVEKMMLAWKKGARPAETDEGAAGAPTTARKRERATA